DSFDIRQIIEDMLRIEQVSIDFIEVFQNHFTPIGELFERLTRIARGQFEVSLIEFEKGFNAIRLTKRGHFANQIFYRNNFRRKNISWGTVLQFAQQEYTCAAVRKDNGNRRKRIEGKQFFGNLPQKSTFCHVLKIKNAPGIPRRFIIIFYKLIL